MHPAGGPAFAFLFAEFFASFFLAVALWCALCPCGTRVLSYYGLTHLFGSSAGAGDGAHDHAAVGDCMAF